MSLGKDSRYDPSRFAAIAQHEDEHFWFKLRRDLIASTVSALVADLPPGYAVLDAGCGTGYVLEQLEKTCRSGRVVGLDLHAEAIAVAQRRVSCTVVQGDLQSYPRDERFSVVGLFDVIEHLDDDVGALRTCAEILTESGSVVVTVPANRLLWSERDVAVGHYRRYSRRSLKAAFDQSGLRVTRLTYFMAPLLPAMLLRRVIGAKGVHPDGAWADHDLTLSPWASRIAYVVERPEIAWLERNHNVPIGASLLAVATRR